MTTTEKIINFLKKEGQLKEQDVKDARKQSLRLNKDIADILVGKGYISKATWLKTKGKVIGYPFRELKKETVPEDVLQIIPAETVRRYKFVPLDKKDEVLEVGMVDPQDREAKEAIRFITSRKGLRPKIFLVSKEGFKHIVRQYESLKGEVAEALEEFEEKAKRREKKRKKRRVEIAEPIAAEAPVSKVVAVILRYGVETKASDIHIEPLENSVKVRFRIDGILHTSLYLKKELHSAIITRVKILSRLKIDETRIPQDGRFHATIDEKKIDFRVSTFPTANGEKAALRILDPSAGIFDLKGLGLSGRNLQVVKEAIKAPYGMILSSGPTGSGKTTTLYTILNILNEEAVNIVSLEDPIEYFIEGVNQSQIRPEIGYSFASGLRYVLRQDPDIIMVGEIRDEETAGLATHASLTGHLLLSTIHTKDAVGIIPRLLDMGVERYLLPTTVSLGIAQRLTRRLCPDCKEEYRPPEDIQQTMKEAWDKIPEEQKRDLGLQDIKWPVSIYKAKGCKACGQTGFKGRIAVFEILKMTSQLKHIIVEDLTESNLRKEARRQGMVTMFQDGIIKTLQGIIPIEEVLRVTKE